MKSYNNLYEKILNKENIRQAIIDVSKHRTTKKDVQRMLQNIDSVVENIYNLLSTNSFKPSKHKPKIINEHSSKKTRKIICPTLTEQIIHHLIIQALEPIFIQKFYTFTIASMPGKGISYGKKYIEKWLRKLQNKNQKIYILKIDIRHFFESINKNILKQKLRKLIRDDRFYILIKSVIDYDFFSNGLPLGFYTSAWLANFYLMEFDYFIKQELKISHYMRYMDDMVLMDTNKSKLHRAFTKMQKYLANNLRLTIKDDWQVFRWSYFDTIDSKEKGRCLDYLGFQFRYNRTTIRKSSLYRLRKKANALYRKRKQNKPLNWYIACQFLSQLGWMLQADTQTYYEKHIKTKVSIKCLKHIIASHSRKESKKANSIAQQQNIL